MKKILKISGIVLSSILALLLITATIFSFIFRNEISTISSIRLLKPRVKNSLQCGIYEMNITGDYYFEDYIAQGGSKNDRELLDFIMNKMTKGLLNLSIKTSKIRVFGLDFRPDSNPNLENDSVWIRRSIRF